MTKKILFICKYNRFRSKFAEAYFNRINKDKNFRAESAGILEVDVPLLQRESKRNKYIKNAFGLEISPRSRGIKVSSLLNASKIIIIADDIPKKIFSSKRWKDKTVVWKIPDEPGDNEKRVCRISNKIIKKVDRLVRDLEGKR